MTITIAKIFEPKNRHIPIIISVPHAGTEFPEEVVSQFRTQHLSAPEDTDWFVDLLYSFALEMGATLVKANLSRYVIDLNRSPKQEKLYNDTRQQTELCPTKTFNGEDLYNENCKPGEDEVAKRLKNYYWPYYAFLQNVISEIQEDFSHALVFDAHSIKRHVESIQVEPFPDMILGDNNGVTSHPSLKDAAWEVLKDSGYKVSYNHPFKGGHISRYWGQPDKKIHALQLEMSQDIYMDEFNTKYSEEKAGEVQKTLRNMLMNLHSAVMRLK